MNNLYNADIVKVDGMLFDKLETALILMTRDWREWIGVGSDEDYQLIEVIQNDDNDIVIRYMDIAGYDENDEAILKPEDMTFEVGLTSMMVLVA